MGAPALDHISLSAPAGEFDRLGFRVTPTPGDPSHARVLLERSYIEVTPPTPAEFAFSAAGRNKTRTRWRGWFLRPDDLEGAARALRDRGIEAVGLQPYEGADGTWLDVTIGGPAAALLPTLTLRRDLPAAAWPPRLDSPHPNGATALTEVRLRSQNPATLTAVLEALGAAAAGPGRFELAAGGAILIDDSPGPEGIVAIALERKTGGQLVVD